MIMPPLWVLEHAETFAGDVESLPDFPRDLEETIVRIYSVLIRRRPDLTIGRLRSDLGRLGIVQIDLSASENRRLHGALFVRSNAAILYVDSADTPAEQRFTIAHELAHYLRECLLPRRRSVERIGRAVPLTSTERLHAFLRNAEAVRYAHLLERESDGSTTDRTIVRAETEADLLAFELLAPAETLARRGLSTQAEAMAVLIREFGFPSSPARRYAERLFPSPPSDRLWHRLEKNF